MMNILDKIKVFLGWSACDGYVGIWEKDEDFLEAARDITKAGFLDVEGITPFPMHGLDAALNLKRSWIPWVAFFGGLIGLAFGIWFTWWTSAVDWPVMVGGKPMWSLPAFVPIIFELVILFSALSSVGVLIFICCGLPRINPVIIDKDLTCHKMALFIYKKDKKYDETKIQEIFKKWNVKEDYETSF